MNITIKPFIEKCVRVWHLLRKPTNQEFKSIAKISSLGVGAIGLIGFLISIFVSFFM